MAVHAAAIRAVEPDGGRLRIRADGDGQAAPSAWEADRIIVAIGPNADATANPLLRRGDRGRLVAPGVRWGSRSTSTRRPAWSSTRGGGTARPVYALGALRKGVLWETIAVPEIREQAAETARPDP